MQAAIHRLRTAAINGGTTPTITYDYDTLGRRLTKNNNGARTGYMLDGDEEIAEYNVDASGVWASTPLRRYVMDRQSTTASPQSIWAPPREPTITSITRARCWR